MLCSPFFPGPGHILFKGEIVPLHFDLLDAAHHQERALVWPLGHKEALNTCQAVDASGTHIIHACTNEHILQPHVPAAPIAFMSKLLF